MVRTFREELTDRMIFYSEKHLYKCLKEYVEYYNERRAHSSLSFNAPMGKFAEVSLAEEGCSLKVSTHAVLGGLIKDFKRVA
jgi:hypothetical protein